MSRDNTENIANELLSAVPVMKYYRDDNYSIVVIPVSAQYTIDGDIY
jgi:hypothetical protein